MLVKCRVPRWKDFRLAGRRVPFTVLDGALMTGLATLEMRVELDGLDNLTDMESLVSQLMYEWVHEWFVVRVVATLGKKAR